MSNRSWVTLATNDSYGLGALVLAHSLRRVHSQYPATVLITPSVTDAMRERLHAVFAEVVTVDVLDSRDAAHLALLQRPELGVTFTKIHCWELTQYEKCVFLDADTLIVQNCDELFEREQLSAAPDVGWPDCFNSGVFVFKPSQETFYDLIKFAEERGSFDGGDQGLLNSFFSDWARGDINKHLPFLYNVTSAAFYSYLPALKHYGHDLKIIHFIGAAKPWLQKYNWESRSVDAPGHLKEFLQLWWDLFVGQVHQQLDVNMVEAPPALPPHDVSQHYVPVVDPESEFPWHHPDAQTQEDSSRPEIDLTQFFDPWELYRGFIPSNRNDEPSHHSLTRRIEDYQEMKEYAWQYQSIHQYDRESSLPNQTYDPYHHDANDHQEIQSQHHYLESNWEASSHQNWESHSQHDWEGHSQRNWEGHSQPNWEGLSQPNWEGHSQRNWEDHSQPNWEGHSRENWESHSQQHWESYSQQNWESHSHGSHTHDNSQYRHQHSESSYQHLQDDNSSQKDHYNLNENKHENIDFEHKQYPHDHHTSHTHHSHAHQTRSQEPIQHNHYSDDSNQYHNQQPISNSNPKIFHDISIDNMPILTNAAGRSNVRIDRYKPLGDTNTTDNHNVTSNGIRAHMNGDVSDGEYDYQEDITPRHPYDGFYLRHRAVIDSHGRKICTHEIPETPMPSPPPETQEVPIFLHAEELFVSNGHAHDEEQSGVAGNLARVVPGDSGVQREALDELTRRQGWEAGNIDYMGADSFSNIWAKISQTLGQPRTSPPKEPSPPPKQPSPPKEQPPVVEAPISEVKDVPVAAEVPAVPETSVVVAPVSEAPVASQVAPVVETAPVTGDVLVPKEVPMAEEELPAVTESSVTDDAPATTEAPVTVETLATEASAAVVETPVEIPTTVQAAAEILSSEIPATIEAAVVPAPAVESVQATTEPLEIPATVEAGEAPASKEVVSEPPKKEPTKKTETAGLPTPASPESTPAPATESLSVEPVVEVVESAKSAASVEASPVPVPPLTTPEKAPENVEPTDSPPLANTPSKGGPPVLPDAKSEERRKGAGKLQLKPPSVADPLPTPDSELEDAAALASSIIASELRTPTVTSPGSEGAPATPPVQPQSHRLSVDEPEVPTPPVDAAVSLAQIGVKPTSKSKTSTAAQIESSVTEKAPEAASVDPPKKKIVKKVVKKDSATSAAAGADAPVPPPRKKEKKPKEK